MCSTSWTVLLFRKFMWTFQLSLLCWSRKLKLKKYVHSSMEISAALALVRFHVYLAAFKVAFYKMVLKVQISKCLTAVLCRKHSKNRFQKECSSYRKPAMRNQAIQKAMAYHLASIILVTQERTFIAAVVDLCKGKSVFQHSQTISIFSTFVQEKLHGHFYGKNIQHTNRMQEYRDVQKLSHLTEKHSVSAYSFSFECSIVSFWMQ